MDHDQQYFDLLPEWEKGSPETASGEDIPEYIDRVTEGLVFSLFNLEKVYNFTRTHRVEVLVQDDWQYHCYVNYKEGDGAWGIGLNFMEALVVGIENYIKNNPDFLG